MADEKLQSGLPENQHKFFDIENITYVSSFKPMLSAWREGVKNNPAYWYDTARHVMFTELPEEERQGSVEDNPIVSVKNRPWKEIPSSIKDLLKTAYDCAAIDPDDQKFVSFHILDKFIRIAMESPSLKTGLFRQDIYGENVTSDIYLQLEDDDHPIWNGYADPSRIPAGFWHFEKWPTSLGKKRDAAYKRAHEEGVEPTIQQRLAFNSPKTRMALCSSYELKDIARFLETSTPHAQVDYVDHRFFPQIAQPPWATPPTHEIVSEDGELKFRPIDDNGQIDSNL
jgi:hypothetical protein